MARTGSRPHYGAKRRIRDDGYVAIWKPDHPLASADGYVAEHRMVVYDAGLLADPALHVHHVNGVKDDNRIENLEVVSAREHPRIHWEERRPDRCPQGHFFDEENTARHANGWRYCKQCNRDKVRRYRLRKRMVERLAA